MNQIILSHLKTKRDLFTIVSFNSLLNLNILDFFTIQNNELFFSNQRTYSHSLMKYDMKNQGIYKNEKRKGLWKNWYPNGQLASEGHYKNGRLIS